MSLLVKKSMPLSSVRDGLIAVESFLQRRGFWILALVALGYYASYCATGLTLTGERGSNVLIAQRILAGERPFVDLFPGYNLLWFYPMSALYVIIGPHWLATRLYFLVLAVATALMGYALVKRVTGQVWLALLAGAFMVLMPGAIFRNYMGFIGVFSMTLLLRAYILDEGSNRRQIAWMALAGAGMAVCFLIRIEPSLLLAVVWIGLAILYPFGIRGHFFRRFRTMLLGTLVGILAFFALHAPFAIDAYRRGFGPQFTSQYTNYIGLFRWELEQELTNWSAGKSAKPSAQHNADASTAAISASGDASANPLNHKDQSPETGREGRKARVALADVFSDGRIYFFAAALWTPVLVAAALTVSGAVLLICSLLSWNAVGKTRALVILGSTGCALSLFPQYFFFRPDSVHLNEFLVAFWPASLCSAWLLIKAAKQSGSMLARIWSFFVAVLVALLFIVSFNALFGRDGSGSIMASRGEDAPFSALNGVHAKVKTSELPDWEGLRDAVIGHSAPDEFVVTYPYVPIVNVMCDRPTYQWSLYVDNATASSSFQQKEGAVLREKKPAVIVINDRAINKTEFSRFSNWASALYGQIRGDYDLVGTFFDRVEVYALRRPAAEAAVPGVPIP